MVVNTSLSKLCTLFQEFLPKCLKDDKKQSMQCICKKELQQFRDFNFKYVNHLEEQIDSWQKRWRKTLIAQLEVYLKHESYSVNNIAESSQINVEEIESSTFHSLNRKKNLEHESSSVNNTTEFFQANVP